MEIEKELKVVIDDDFLFNGNDLTDMRPDEIFKELIRDKKINKILGLEN
jgi:hypothetical protein